MGGKQLGFSDYDQTTALPRPQAERAGGTRRLLKNAAAFPTQQAEAGMRRDSSCWWQARVIPRSRTA
jgi:hypothetical protein